MRSEASKIKIAAYKKQWAIDNSEKMAASRKKWRDNNPEKIKLIRVNWVNKNREKVNRQARESASRNRDKIILKRRLNYSKNRESLLAKQNEWRSKNREHFRAQGRVYFFTNKPKYYARSRIWRIKNREKTLAWQRAWRKNNKGHIRKYANERYASNPEARLASLMRSRVNKLIKRSRTKKINKTMEIIGLSLKDLKSYIESLWQPGMSWENRTMWHIDHIKPCSSFDLTDPEQQKICFHYTNLQPLWWQDNLRKSDKLNYVK